MGLKGTLVEVDSGCSGPASSLKPKTQTACSGEEVHGEATPLAVPFEPLCEPLGPAAVPVPRELEIVAPFQGYAIVRLLHSTHLHTSENTEHQEITDALVEARIPPR